VSLTRRDLLLTAAAAPAIAIAPAGAAAPANAAPIAAVAPLTLPAKAAFAPMPYTYLDSGSTHPMSLGAKAALQDYLTYKTRDRSGPTYDMDDKEKAVIAGSG